MRLQKAHLLIALGILGLLVAAACWTGVIESLLQAMRFFLQ